MVTISEETSDEEGSDDTDDTEPDCKFFLEMWLVIRGLWKRIKEKERERERKRRKRKKKEKEKIR